MTAGRLLLGLALIGALGAGCELDDEDSVEACLIAHGCELKDARAQAACRRASGCDARPPR